MTPGYSHLWNRASSNPPASSRPRPTALTQRLIRLSLTAATMAMGSLVGHSWVIAQTEHPSGFTKDITSPVPASPSAQDSAQDSGPPPQPNLSTELQRKGPPRSAIAGALVGGGTLMGTVLWRRHRHKQLNEQLAALKGRTANIMTLCDDLLTGKEPTQTLHYQLFTAAGGEKYPELIKQITAWLSQARQSLDQAFVIRNSLEQQSPQRLKSLAQTVGNWELLYLSLIGHSPNLQTLSESQLKIQLDPLQSNPQEQANVDNPMPVADSLQTLQHKITPTTTTIEFLIIKPDETDPDTLSIVEHIDQINLKIRTIKESEHSAPKQLSALQQKRQALANQLPTEFDISPEQILSGIDHSLEMATETLDKTLFLYTLDHCQTAAQSIAHLEEMIAALSILQQRQDSIDTILQKGYRPNELPTHTKTLQACLDQLQQYLQDNNYAAIARQSEILNQLTQARLNHVQAWETQHQQNQSAIETLLHKLSELQHQDKNQAEPAWQTLKTYPEDNWKMVETSLSTARQLLEQAEQESLPQIKFLNSLEQQDLQTAKHNIQHVLEQLLAPAEAHLEQVWQQAQKIQTLATNLATMLVRAEENITHVDNLIRPKALGLLQLQKIDPRLANAQSRIVQARQSIHTRHFMTALATHNEANRAMLIVYRDKVQTELNRVQALFNHRYARGAKRQTLNKAAEQLQHVNNLDSLDETNIEQYVQTLDNVRNDIDAVEKMVKATIRRNRSRGY